MKEFSLSKLLLSHVKISLLIILIWLILLFSFFGGWQNIELLTILAYLLIIILFFLPIFLAIYIGYILMLKKINFSKILAPFLLIIATFILPYYGHKFSSGADGPNWALFGVQIITIGNILLLIANEILLFINLKKLK